MCHSQEGRSFIVCFGEMLTWMALLYLKLFLFFHQKMRKQQKFCFTNLNLRSHFPIFTLLINFENKLNQIKIWFWPVFTSPVWRNWTITVWGRNLANGQLSEYIIPGCSSKYWNGAYAIHLNSTLQRHWNMCFVFFPCDLFRFQWYIDHIIHPQCEKLEGMVIGKVRLNVCM